MKRSILTDAVRLGSWKVVASELEELDAPFTFEKLEDGLWRCTLECGCVAVATTLRACFEGVDSHADEVHGGAKYTG